MSEGASPQTEMTPERWHQIRDLLADAIRLSAEDRPQYVAKVCGGDSALQADLESLLAAHEIAEGGIFEKLPLGITAGPAMPMNDCNRAKELVETPLDLEPRQRTTFLADGPMREQVEKLLRKFQETAHSQGDPGVSCLSEAPTAEIEEPMVGRRLGAYKLVKRIGLGGMAAVFLARRADDEYQKEVAIKLVQPGLDSQELLNRFRNERQTLADLDHPNIVKLLDGGSTAEGSPFLVMDYVEGSPIDDHCDRRKLCVDDRLRLFSKVCEAVQYAHQNSIVHRDLKPSNILVTDDGTAKVLDFGIAKVLSAQPSAQALLVTQTGTRCLTPAYASPEQVRGKSITTATDIYSLGVVLYELLSGHRPYRLKENTPVEIERAICEQEPEPPSTAVSRVETEATSSGIPVTKTPERVSETRERPPEKLRRRLRGDLDNIVLKALQKEPEKRYASVEEFSQDITRHLQHLPVKARRRTLVYRSSKFVRRHKTQLPAVLVLVLVAAAATAWTSNSFGIRDWFLNGATSTRIHSLGVLPLANLSGDPSQEYFSDGMTDSLITDLSQISSLKVISRTSSMQYKNTKKSLPQIARELNVDGIIEGTVQQSGDWVRITAQLIEAKTDRHLWARSYERNSHDVMVMQDELARDIAEQIRSKLTPREQTRLTVDKKTNPRTYDAYLRGRYFLNQRNAKAVAKAVGYFQQAVQEDPNFAPSYSGLADCYSLGWDAKSHDPPLAEQYARKAVSLQPDLAEGHVSLGATILLQYQVASAEPELRRALELNPNLAMAHHIYAIYLLAQGRPADALVENDRAKELDPFSFPINAMRAVILIGLRQYSRAVEQLEKTSELDPQSRAPHSIIARIHWLEGRALEAIAEENNAATLSNSPQRLQRLRNQKEVAATYAKLGLHAAQLKAAQLMERNYKGNYEALSIAFQYGTLEDKDKVVQWLAQSLHDHENNLLFDLKSAPEFGFLHPDPSYMDLVSRLGLSP